MVLKHTLYFISITMNLSTLRMLIGTSSSNYYKSCKFHILMSTQKGPTSALFVSKCSLFLLYMCMILYVTIMFFFKKKKKSTCTIDVRDALFWSSVCLVCATQSSCVHQQPLKTLSTVSLQCSSTHLPSTVFLMRATVYSKSLSAATCACRIILSLNQALIHVNMFYSLKFHFHFPTESIFIVTFKCTPFCFPGN